MEGAVTAISLFNLPEKRSADTFCASLKEIAYNELLTFLSLIMVAFQQCLFCFRRHTYDAYITRKLNNLQPTLKQTRLLST
jgi:hypothetical protein